MKVEIERGVRLRFDVEGTGLVPYAGAGGRLDPVCPPVCASDLVAAIDPKLVKLELFEQCGHGVFRDDPGRAFPALLGFISS